MPKGTPFAANATPSAANVAAALALAHNQTVWKWAQTLDASGTATAVADPSLYTIEFVANINRVFVRADCRAATGSFRATGQDLTILIESITGAICAPGSLSNQFVGDISNASSFSFDPPGQNVSGQALLLKTGSGSTLRFAQ